MELAMEVVAMAEQWSGIAALAWAQLWQVTLLVVVVARLSQHPKVPATEQRLSAGCAAQGVLLAAEACGYAGIWRTGDSAFDRNVMSALGLDASEEIIAFVYLGSRAGKAKPIPELDTAAFVSSW